MRRAAAALLLALLAPAAAAEWVAASHFAWSGWLYYAPWAPPTRDYRLHVPLGYRHGTPAPLVVMLHGCTQQAEEFARGTRMNALADAQGFLVLYPQQDALANGKRCWNWFDPRNQAGSGEAALIAGMVERVARDYSVDRRRVYVAGLSAGGAMAAILAACQPRLFAAAAIHSGVPYRAARDPWSAASALERGGSESPEASARAAWECGGAARLQVPVLLIHGTADARVAPVNADQLLRQFAQLNDLADDGQDNDSVNAQPAAETRASAPGGRRYALREYRSGGRPLMRELRVEGLGHAWSGGDASQPHNDRAGPDASALIWDFFLQHSR